MVVLPAACAFAALLAVQAVNMRRRRNSEEKVLKGYFLLGLSGLMAKLAMADGRVTGDEAELADGFFRKMDVTEAERALLFGNFITARRDGLEPRDHVKRFLAYANPTTCEFLYDLLWRISRADGVVDPAEDQLLREIALYLGLGESAYEFFRDGKNRRYERAALKACGVASVLRAAFGACEAHASRRRRACVGREPDDVGRQHDSRAREGPSGASCRERLAARADGRAGDGGRGGRVTLVRPCEPEVKLESEKGEGDELLVTLPDLPAWSVATLFI